MLKAKAADVADGPQEPALVAAPVRLGHILQHGQVVLPGHSHDLVHARGHAAHVHGDDDLGIRGDLGLQVLGVHIERGIHLSDDGHAPGGDDRRCCGHIGVGGDDHLVARADVHAK